MSQRAAGRSPRRLRATRTFDSFLKCFLCLTHSHCSHRFRASSHLYAFPGESSQISTRPDGSRTRMRYLFLLTVHSNYPAQCAACILHQHSDCDASSMIVFRCVGILATLNGHTHNYIYVPNYIRFVFSGYLRELLLELNVRRRKFIVWKETESMKLGLLHNPIVSNYIPSWQYPLVTCNSPVVVGRYPIARIL